MQVSKRDVLCQVIGFNFLTGRETFSGVSCPLTVSEDKARGVAVLCNIFKVKNGIVTSSGQPFKYIDIKYFKMHVKLKRDLYTNDLRIV